MKKTTSYMAIIVIILSGCGINVNSVTAEPPSETVKALFEKAVNTIKDYTAEETVQSITAKVTDAGIKFLSCVFSK